MLEPKRSMLRRVDVAYGNWVMRTPPSSVRVRLAPKYQWKMAVAQVWVRMAPLRVAAWCMGGTATLRNHTFEVADRGTRRVSGTYDEVIDAMDRATRA